MTSACSAPPSASRYIIRAESLAAGIVMLAVLNIAARGIGFARAVVVCRWLPPEQLGHWDLALAFLQGGPMLAVLCIPTCFTRYLEAYRQRNQLRTFLSRTLLAVALLSGLAVAVLWAGRATLGQMLVGVEDPQFAALAIAALPALILCNTLQVLFNALRMFRTLCMMQFTQSVLFAVLAVVLAVAWPSASAVLMAFGLAGLLCSLGPLYWLLRTRRALPADGDPPPLAPFWTKMSSFVLSVCVTNALLNLLAVGDRYMILHFSGQAPDVAAAMVGQYHAARLVPVMLNQLTDLIGMMVVPHVTHHWEAGRSDLVSTRLNTLVKLMGLATTAASGLVLVAGPLLFAGLLHGKFTEGQAVLPWMLLCAVWYGMYCTAKNYLWCDERVRLLNLGLLVALAISVGMNLLLLPRWGLQGAAVAQSLTALTTLAAGFGFAALRGMRIGRGTWLVSAVPVALCLGPAAVWTVLAGMALVSIATEWVFDRQEKQHLLAAARKGLARWWPYDVSGGPAERPAGVGQNA